MTQSVEGIRLRNMGIPQTAIISTETKKPRKTTVHACMHATKWSEGTSSKTWTRVQIPPGPPRVSTSQKVFNVVWTLKKEGYRRHGSRRRTVIMPL